MTEQYPGQAAVNRANEAQTWHGRVRRYVTENTGSFATFNVSVVMDWVVTE